MREAMQWQPDRARRRVELLVSSRVDGWYDGRVALVRILIDGYSLLHAWPELAEGRARHSAEAREELVRLLTQYRDATGIPITIFFDGAGGKTSACPISSNRDVEVLYSRGSQTADDLIERAAHRFKTYGEVLVVTDDLTERDLIRGMDGMTSSCANFIRDLDGALGTLTREIATHNRKEGTQFRRNRETR
jgi:predicted RNA-binding protein with PIN domain